MSPAAIGSTSAALPRLPSSSPEPTTSTDPVAGPATFEDPAMALTLARDWRAIAESTVRLQLEQASSMMTGPYKALVDQKLADLDAGSLRLFVVGPSGFDPWQGTMSIEVFDGGSADTRIGALEARAKTLGVVTNVNRGNVTLLIGSATRLSMTVGVPKGFDQSAIPSHGVAYAVDLGDGRTLVIDASGPEAATSFADLIDMMVSTLRPR